MVILVFMVISGSNFPCITLSGKAVEAGLQGYRTALLSLRSTIASILITLNIYQTCYETLIEAARNGFFQVVSITTTQVMQQPITANGLPWQG